MGYGQQAAQQVETLLIYAGEGVFTEDHVRDEAKQIWSTLTPAEQQEATQILHGRNLPNGR